MAKPDVKVTIAGDASSLEKEAAKAQRAMGDFGDKAEGSAKRGSGALKSFAAGVGLGFGVDQVAQFGKELYDTGLRLETLRAKSKTVFEGQIGDVQKWADENAAAMGLTRTELVGTAAAAADLLKPMGFTAQAATDMSKEMVGLSGALSAWSGGSRTAAEVSTILQKSLLGERDGLKELGISILDADVKTRLAATGQDKLTGAALEQAKAQVTLQLIMEKSTDAQKAWNDGSMDQVKAANEAKAGVMELKDSMATALMPVFREATKEINDNLIPAMEGLGDIAKAAGKFAETDAGGALKRFGKIALGDPVAGIREIAGQWSRLDDIWKGSELPAVAIRMGELAKKVEPVDAALKLAAGASAAFTKELERTEEQAKDTERNAKEYEKALSDVEKKTKDLLQASEDLWGGRVIDMPEAIDGLRGDLLDYYDAQKDAEKATKEHGAASAEAQRALIDQGSAARDIYGDLDKVAKVALDNAENQATLAGKTLTTNEKIGIQKQALEDLKKTFPELAGPIDQAKAKFGELASSSEDAGARVVAAMQKMADDLAGIFNRLDIGNGLSMIVATADRLTEAAGKINGATSPDALAAATRVHGSDAMQRAIGINTRVT